MKHKMIGITAQWYCANVIHINSRILRNALLPLFFERRNVTALRAKRGLHSISGQTFNVSKNAINDQAEEFIQKTRADIRMKRGTSVKQSESKGPIQPAPTISVPRSIDLITKEGAESIVKLIGNDIAKKPSFVVDLNPGKGLLATELLKLNIPKLYLFCQHYKAPQELQSLTEEHKGRLILRDEDFKNFSKIYFLDVKTGNNRLREILDGIVEREWEDDCYVQFIRITTETNIIRHLTMSVIFQNALMAFGRPCFYFIIVPSIWHEFENTGTWRTIASAMFSLLFDVEMLGTVDRNHFSPKPKKIAQPRRERYRGYGCTVAQLRYENEKFLRVVKIQPKRNLFEDIVNEDDLIPLWLFMRHYLHKRMARVIPQMEQYSPNCTMKLIKMNYTFFTEFRELDVKEILDLFKEFRTWPEYKNTTFVSAVDNIMKDVESTYLNRTEYDYFADNSKHFKPY